MGDRWVTSTNLFRALDAALAEWESAPGRSHLIVNMSLGWDPADTQGSGLKVKWMTQLLSRAYCEGALVIAAAGNRTGSEGAVFPAALESLAPPDAQQCGRLGYSLVGSSGSYRPLIHAVGAVDQYDQRLVLARPHGQPRLAAYGMQVVVPGQTATGFTIPQTGTSMSAAVVSGIAAAVWGARPDSTLPV